MTDPGAVPEPPRRPELGAASARSLLLTVLGEFVLPGDEPVWTAAFLTVLGGLGVAPKTARQALARTAAAGWLRPARHGRRTAWRLTPAGRDLLAAGAERIYGHAARGAGWDGTWLLVVAALPERDRRARHRLRARLAWAGLGRLATDLWVGAHPERQGELRRTLESAGLAASVSVFLARLGELGDPGRIARQAWDLDGVERRYEEFIDAARRLAPRDGAQTLLAQLRLVQEWRRFPFLDPDLPGELLPARWRGHEAAALFAERHARWGARARAEWGRLRMGG
jgi:phenylacetic acid degradation operon negative regulatory protein